MEYNFLGINFLHNITLSIFVLVCFCFDLNFILCLVQKVGFIVIKIVCCCTRAVHVNRSSFYSN